MRVVAINKLEDAQRQYPSSEKMLAGWYQVLCHGNFPNESSLRATFGDIRGFKGLYKFPIPKSRLLIQATIHFDSQVAFVESVRPGNP